jgi:hypothetical protein
MRQKHKQAHYSPSVCCESISLLSSLGVRIGVWQNSVAEVSLATCEQAHSPAPSGKLEEIVNPQQGFEGSVQG